MRNHFHLGVETPNAKRVAGMRWLLSAYAIGLNHRLMERMEGRLGELHSGEMRLETGEAKAERIIGLSSFVGGVSDPANREAGGMPHSLRRSE